MVKPSLSYTPPRDKRYLPGKYLADVAPAGPKPTPGPEPTTLAGSGVGESLSVEDLQAALASSQARVPLDPVPAYLNEPSGRRYLDDFKLGYGPAFFPVEFDQSVVYTSDTADLDAPPPPLPLASETERRLAQIEAATDPYKRMYQQVYGRTFEGALKAEAPPEAPRKPVTRQALVAKKLSGKARPPEKFANAPLPRGEPVVLECYLDQANFTNGYQLLIPRSWEGFGSSVYLPPPEPCVQMDVRFLGVKGSPGQALPTGRVRVTIEPI